MQLLRCVVVLPLMLVWAVPMVITIALLELLEMIGLGLLALLGAEDEQA